MTRREEIVKATKECREDYVGLGRHLTSDDIADAFEEGLKVLNIKGNRLCVYNSGITQYERGLYIMMSKLSKLLICRDAYWKIAGEEMGLGEPWKPDWNIYEHKFCLGTDKDKIIEERVTTGNRILAFPTPEMRDAFYENFKELIEQCKELL